MRITFAALLLAIGLVGQAVSQDLDDDAYVNDYFGTSAIIFSVDPLADPNLGWWADGLPDELVYDTGYVVGLVNAYRIGKGEDQLIPPDSYVVATGWEAEAVDGSGFEYNIDFIGLRPSEVEMVISALGGMEQYFAGVELYYVPLLVHNFYEYTESLDAPIVFTVGSQAVEIDVTQHISEVLDQLGAIFTEEYGYHTINGISLTYSIYDGYESTSLSFDVELPAG